MKASSKVLQLVDESLKLALAGRRGIDNTIILDRWRFCSTEILDREVEEERSHNNEKVF